MLVPTLAKNSTYQEFIYSSTSASLSSSCISSHEEKPVEWAGFNAYLERQEASTSTKKPKTLVVFGPLLDAPPAHPDTVMTTLVYLENTSKTFGIQYAHISVDLQLYQISCLVQWSDPYRWKSLVLHPGIMHNVVSWVHRDADEGIRRGCAVHCSVRGTRWHHHRKVMA